MPRFNIDQFGSFIKTTLKTLGIYAHEREEDVAERIYRRKPDIDLFDDFIDYVNAGDRREDPAKSASFNDHENRQFHQLGDSSESDTELRDNVYGVWTQSPSTTLLAIRPNIPKLNKALMFRIVVITSKGGIQSKLDDFRERLSGFRVSPDHHLVKVHQDHVKSVANVILNMACDMGVLPGRIFKGNVEKPTGAASIYHVGSVDLENIMRFHAVNYEKGPRNHLRSALECILAVSKINYQPSNIAHTIYQDALKDEPLEGVYTVLGWRRNRLLSLDNGLCIFGVFVVSYCVIGPHLGGGIMRHFFSEGIMRVAGRSAEQDLSTRIAKVIYRFMLFALETTSAFCVATLLSVARYYTPQSVVDFFGALTKKLSSSLLTSGFVWTLKVLFFYTMGSVADLAGLRWKGPFGDAVAAVASTLGNVNMNIWLKQSVTSIGFEYLDAFSCAVTSTVTGVMSTVWSSNTMIPSKSWDLPVTESPQKGENITSYTESIGIPASWLMIPSTGLSFDNSLGKFLQNKAALVGSIEATGIVDHEQATTAVDALFSSDSQTFAAAVISSLNPDTIDAISTGVDSLRAMSDTLHVLGTIYRNVPAVKAFVDDYCIGDSGIKDFIIAANDKVQVSIGGLIAKYRRYRDGGLTFVAKRALSDIATITTKFFQPDSTEATVEKFIRLSTVRFYAGNTFIHTKFFRNVIFRHFADTPNQPFETTHVQLVNAIVNDGAWGPDKTELRILVNALQKSAQLNVYTIGYSQDALLRLLQWKLSGDARYAPRGESETLRRQLSLANRSWPLAKLWFQSYDPLAIIDRAKAIEELALFLSIPASGSKFQNIPTIQDMDALAIYGELNNPGVTKLSVMTSVTSMMASLSQKVGAESMDYIANQIGLDLTSAMGASLSVGTNMAISALVGALSTRAAVEGFKELTDVLSTIQAVEPQVHYFIGEDGKYRVAAPLSMVEPICVLMDIPPENRTIEEPTRKEYETFRDKNVKWCDHHDCKVVIIPSETPMANFTKQSGVFTKFSSRIQHTITFTNETMTDPQMEHAVYDTATVVSQFPHYKKNLNAFKRDYIELSDDDKERVVELGTYSKKYEEFEIPSSSTIKPKIIKKLTIDMNKHKTIQLYEKGLRKKVWEARDNPATTLEEVNQLYCKRLVTLAEGSLEEAVNTLKRAKDGSLETRLEIAGAPAFQATINDDSLRESLSNLVFETYINESPMNFITYLAGRATEEQVKAKLVVRTTLDGKTPKPGMVDIYLKTTSNEVVSKETWDEFQNHFKDFEKDLLEPRIVDSIDDFTFGPTPQAVGGEGIDSFEQAINDPEKKKVLKHIYETMQGSSLSQERKLEVLREFQKIPADKHALWGFANLIEPGFSGDLEEVRKGLCSGIDYQLYTQGKEASEVTRVFKGHNITMQDVEDYSNDTLSTFMSTLNGFKSNDKLSPVLVDYLVRQSVHRGAFTTYANRLGVETGIVNQDFFQSIVAVTAKHKLAMDTDSIDRIRMVTESGLKLPLDSVHFLDKLARTHKNAFYGVLAKMISEYVPPHQAETRVKAEFDPAKDDLNSVTRRGGYFWTGEEPTVSSMTQHTRETLATKLNLKSSDPGNHMDAIAKVFATVNPNTGFSYIENVYTKAKSNDKAHNITDIELSLWFQHRVRPYLSVNDTVAWEKLKAHHNSRNIVDEEGIQTIVSGWLGDSESI